MMLMLMIKRWLLTRSLCALLVQHTHTHTQTNTYWHQQQWLAKAARDRWEASASESGSLTYHGRQIRTRSTWDMGTVRIRHTDSQYTGNYPTLPKDGVRCECVCECVRRPTLETLDTKKTDTDTARPSLMILPKMDDTLAAAEAL